MGATTEKVLKEALHLSATERAVVAESLLSSLDQPDPEINRLWAKEAEARIDAADRGEMETVSEEDVFAKYDSPWKFVSIKRRNANLIRPLHTTSGNYLVSVDGTEKQ